MLSEYLKIVMARANPTDEEIRFYIRQLESTGRYNVTDTHAAPQFGTPTPVREMSRHTSAAHTIISSATGRPITSSVLFSSGTQGLTGPVPYSRSSSTPLDPSAIPYPPPENQDVSATGFQWPNPPDGTTLSSRVPPPPPQRASSLLRNTFVDPFATKVPKLPKFSGEDAQGEVDFDTWRFDVSCLVREGVYRHHSILEAIRNSLQGKARRALVNLGEFATVMDVVKRLEGIYGNVLTPEKVKEELYSAVQREGESLADFSIRLEQLFSRAQLESASCSRDSVLCERLWSGLRDVNLRNLSRYKYESVKDFNLLRKELRLLEKDLQLSSLPRSSGVPSPSSPPPGPSVSLFSSVQPVTSPSADKTASLNLVSADSQVLKELKSLTSSFKALESKFSGMEKELKSLKGQSDGKSGNNSKAQKGALNGQTPRP